MYIVYVKSWKEVKCMWIFVGLCIRCFNTREWRLVVVSNVRRVLLHCPKKYTRRSSYIMKVFGQDYSWLKIGIICSWWYANWVLIHQIKSLTTPSHHPIAFDPIHSDDLWLSSHPSNCWQLSDGLSTTCQLMIGFLSLDSLHNAKEK